MSLEEDINDKTINYVSKSEPGTPGQINNNKIVGLSLKDDGKSNQ